MVTGAENTTAKNVMALPSLEPENLPLSADDGRQLFVSETKTWSEEGKLKMLKRRYHAVFGGGDFWTQNVVQYNKAMI